MPMITTTIRSSIRVKPARFTAMFAFRYLVIALLGFRLGKEVCILSACPATARQPPSNCLHLQAITGPQSRHFRNILKDNELHGCSAVFTCCQAVFFATILAVCKRKWRLL